MLRDNASLTRQAYLEFDLEAMFDGGKQSVGPGDLETPAGVEVMIHNKHEVLVEKDAGLGSGFSNAEYKKAGATIVDKVADIYAKAEKIALGEVPMRKTRFRPRSWAR